MEKKEAKKKVVVCLSLDRQLVEMMHSERAARGTSLTFIVNAALEAHYKGRKK